MKEKDISANESLREFICSVFDDIDSGLTACHNKEKDIFILRYVFTMADKKYLGKIPLEREEAANLAKYIMAELG